MNINKLLKKICNILMPEFIKPYPGESSCRIRDPKLFQKKSFRRIKNGRLYIIIGKLKGKKTTTTQAYRYPISSWKVSEARKHCKSKGGRFHPPKKKK
jgi:hypothetical protein